MSFSISQRAVRALFGALVGAAAFVAAACGGSESSTSPIPPQPVDTIPVAGFSGFDAATYPGDAAMAAWRYPSSPYRWTGYYLAAPCHRDPSWVGKLATITSMGWGTAALYVGQQDWSQIPADLAPLDVAPLSAPLGASHAARVDRPSTSLVMVTCSASLLSNAQGASEAVDAATKMAADGFPARSTIFLDVEYVTNVTPALLDYYQGWIAGVLRDGRYLPGVYAAKSNAQTLYDAAVAAYRAAGRTDAPPFWIASSVGFYQAKKPSDVGLSFAQLWQGQFDVTQQFNGVQLVVDVDLAATANPSAPNAVSAVSASIAPNAR